MRKLSRRQVLTGIGAAIVGTGVLRYLVTRDPITQEEYRAAERTLYNLEHEIDQEHSGFRPNSDSLIIYLPDQHTKYYAKGQRKRIQSIDQNIELNAIGLEGMAGLVDELKVKRLLERSETYWDANTIPTSVPDPERDYDPSNTDSPEIRLQKLRVKFEESEDVTIDGFYKNPTFQKDLRERNKRYSAYTEFSKSMWDLFFFIPNEQSQFFHGEDAASRFMSMREFQGNDPRITAPGLLYYDLETKAQKIGIENQGNDEKSMDFLDAYKLQLDTSRIDIQLAETNRLFERVKAGYGGIGTKEEQARLKKMTGAYETFTKELTSYKEAMTSFRDTILTRVSPKTRDAILSCSYNSKEKEPINPPEFDQLVVRTRSQDWVDNLSDHRTSMLIGGIGHTETIAQAAKDNNVSLISLTKLD
tara:strand:+ start:596 stop:1846 length:1251 start_codon:yes stop_codon:yes gene_type:complete